ncbi:MAG TPA: ABC transporter ATP-binding protein, partial [Chitinolyticbacter sp.]|nr:ABC transporter ATP-binding protein [Chitinolyticbacter sp.]
MFGWFEKRVQPYPEATPVAPPRDFFAFVWAGTAGMRALILAVMLLTAAIGAFEALLFAMLGSVVDWLASVPRAELFAREGGKLVWLGLALIGSTLLVAVQALCKYQALAGNFPMRLRWNFHRYLLDQSMSFYQDEFAGRVATKVMQTALAVRETVMIIVDILVFVSIYFLTMLAVVGQFDGWLVWPFVVWLLLYALAVWYFVPRLGKASSAQADARSLMTGRVTDAYANIATVKLFSHAQREAGYVKSAMREFLQTVHRQMRLVSGFEIVNHFLNMLLIVATTGATLWLWSLGTVGIGAVAAATAMALRLNGISHWIMWEMANLFEQIGTVQDGITTLTRPVAVIDRADAPPLEVSRGEIRFDEVTFGYGKPQPVIDRLSLTIRAGEK